ncbi:hypothetical protein GCM10009530_08560 [Microbispora corallina]|uniref:Class I SAM-dependent methyltransferase n=1 Tax=Microbispora corallina TaxID=83302 RepID=A0ABQ4FVI3_9ACTN|nr:hypothetical protein [Microbispora corallina]GIH38819.1 hypothetical protein Mco01_18190 [Microbispora corallina]
MTSSPRSGFDRFLVRVTRLLMQPGRVPLAVMRRLPFGSYELRCALDLFPRPHYAYGVQQAAELARRLGVGRISVIEFGVAGGAGLVEMSRQARLASAATGVHIEVYGFDTGAGLPKPTDHRDLPYIWREGDFSMDVDALQARLPDAVLILGNIADTAREFLDDRRPAPIGFVSIDVDFYSSTAAALGVFAGDHKYFLPRVFCYLDDTVGDDDQILHNEFVGELCAIREFNEANTALKLAPINGLRHKRAVAAPWNDNIYALHRFDHPDYGRYVGRPDSETELPLV